MKKTIFFRSIMVIIVIILTISFNNFFLKIGEYFDDILLYGEGGTKLIGKDKIVVIEIDDKTIDELQKLDQNSKNLSQRMFSDAITNLIEDYGVSVIGIDAIFSNKGFFSDEKDLYDVLQQYKDKVVIGARGDNYILPDCKYNLAYQGAIDLGNENDVGVIVRKVQTFFPNYKPLNCVEGKYEKNSANYNGISNFGIEVFRRYIGNADIFSKVKLYSIYNGKDVSLGEFSKREKLFTKEILYGFERSLEKFTYDGNIYINFYKDTFAQNENEEENLFGIESYSLIDILHRKNNIDLSGKIVLIGETAKSTQNLYQVPISNEKRMSEVAIHTNIIRTLYNGGYIEPLTQLQQTIALFLSVASFLFLVCFFSRLVINFSYGAFYNIIGNFVILFLFILLQIIFGKYLFLNGYIYPISFVITGLLFAYILNYLYNYFIEESNKKFMKKAFSHYVSPLVVEELNRNPDALKLRGARGNLAIFFSDIYDFTAISETMNPEDLFKMLNEYLANMTLILTRNKGTLDKFIGDSVMGFFGAPLKLDSPAFNACITALEQQKALIRLNEKWQYVGWPAVRVRIGISYGNVIYGNLGGIDRFDYTVIGDCVNLGSRLEGLNKFYGTNICVSQDVYEMEKENFLFRELDCVAVKGKTEGEKIYELLGKKGAEINEDFIKNYEEGLYEYYKGNYDEAIKCFAKNENGDPPSVYMTIRCKSILSGKTRVRDGVFKFYEK